MEGFIIGAFLYVLLGTSIIPLTDYSSGGINLKVPRGWVVDIFPEQGQIVIKNSPSLETASITLMTGYLTDQNLDAINLLNSTLNQYGNVNIESKKESKEMASARGKIEYGGNTYDFSCFYIVDFKNKIIYYGNFIANKSEFEKSGGESLLYEVAKSLNFEGFRGENLFAISKTEKETYKQEGIKSEEKYSQSPVTASSSVIGKWKGGASYIRLVESAEGALYNPSGLGSSEAEGNEFTFNQDGTYEHVFSGWVNPMYLKRTETGHYKINGNQLILYPQFVKQEPYWEKGVEPPPSGWPPRIFTFIEITQNKIVIRGPCDNVKIDCESGKEVDLELKRK
ncbi:MAG: hypothetical protein ABIM85_03070 [candidate division WOR-3 bacterium]